MILTSTRVWLAAAVLLFTTPLLAQKTAPAPIVYGGVTAADFTPLPQADSTQAPAEYLCDYGTSKIEGGRGQFQVIFERTTRLRIHRKAGYRYATVRVPLYMRDGKIERLVRLRGMTYNLQDGRLVKTKLNPDALFREELDKNHLQYTFTMPEVREGSIVEFSYVINSDFIFNLQDWQFEHRIPVRWSEYRAFLPQFYTYKTITRGYLPFVVNESLTVPYATTYTSESVGMIQGTEQHLMALAQQLRWAMKDVPAFHDEPFMTTPTDYLRSVHFELAGVNFDGTYRDLTGQWQGIWERLSTDDEFGAAMTKPTPALQAQAQVLRQRFPSDSLARAAAVLALVQRSVVYNDEQRIYASQPLRRTVERRLGNSADINLLLVQTLRAAGLPATPLLLSTRDHGQVQMDVPVISQFNYVAAHLKLPGRPDVLLDATEPQLPLGMLPERCLNGEGRLADASGRWVPLKATGRYIDYRTARLQLSPNGELTGTVKLEYGGYAAVAARRQIRQTSAASYLGQLSRRWQDWQPTKPELLPDSLPKPLSVELHLQHTPANAEAALLYLPLLNLPDALPYDFKTENRIYPVNFGMAREHVTVVTLTLPKGYIVQEIPAKLTMEIPGGTGRYVYQVTQPTPGSVELTARLQLNRAEYSSQEYGALRELNRRIIAKQNEPLVLKRVP
ncbi:DUF3857 domain-containing protein [Hymenobacter chitinivorans]|uniref:Uncharacterized protein DUF3857 n=1 Tax=Hymenobacter chitinivorans DSM 11115 TaxID=1121954 RepID=A0A2M9BLW0_9BACT|nr:DUF3857 domain-containing protein [Hymenobacter chitinivorans]PJJ58944.1 uncharacterized protein DUF3857 [Hymenobacter chitinivorans DSM 11115]